jgi:hypothetical protein
VELVDCLIDWIRTVHPCQSDRALVLDRTHGDPIQSDGRQLVDPAAASPASYTRSSSAGTSRHLPVPVDTTSVSKRSIHFQSPVTLFLNFSVWFSSKGKKKGRSLYIPYLNFLFSFSRFHGTQSMDYACFVPCFSRFFILELLGLVAEKTWRGKKRNFKVLYVFGSVLLG